jgi:hypothetical protein
MVNKDNVKVGDISSTQRISVKPQESGIVIQKEYRKDSDEDWRVSKGIEVPRKMIPTLVEHLNTL